MHAEKDIAHAKSMYDSDPNPSNQKHLQKTLRKLSSSFKKRVYLLETKVSTQMDFKGDANTFFFHAHCQNRGNHLCISKIKDYSEAILDSQDAIKSEVVRFFSTLFSDDTSSSIGPRSSILDYVLSLVTLSANSMLDKLPILKEVREAVSSLVRDSTLGLDGFFKAFFTHSWDIISVDILQAILDFCAGLPLPKSFSTTSIVLIPKIPNPISFLDFGPICLCNFVNKILSKFLALRLEVFLPSIISGNQITFLKDRYITDNIFLALELTHSINRANPRGNLIIKLDLQNAFDRVS